MPLQYPCSYEALSRFPLYQSATEYIEQRGTPPPWNPRKLVKRWYDADAPHSVRRTVVYSDCVTGLVIGGVPEVDTCAFSREEAATVNIPPVGWAEATLGEVPLPIRPLLPNEELFVDMRFGGVIGVRDKRVPTDTGLLVEIHALCQRIATKLGA